MLTFILYILGGLALLLGGLTMTIRFADPANYIKYFGSINFDTPAFVFASGFVFIALGRILSLLNDIRDQSKKDNL